MTVTFFLLLNVALRCYSEMAFVRNAHFLKDSFVKDARSSLEDHLAQGDHVLQADSYRRGALWQGSSRTEEISNGIARGGSEDTVSKEHDRGSFNYSMDRAVDQQALLKTARHDSGLTVQSQFQDAELDNGVKTRGIVTDTVERGQLSTDFEKERQAMLSHNTSQTVIDRGVQHAARRQNAIIVPFGGKGSFAADSAKTQDHASILDLDIAWDHERDLHRVERSQNDQRRAKLGKSESSVVPDRAQARNVERVDEQSVQYAKLAQGLHERSSIIDETGTKDLQSIWEKDKVKRAAVIESSSGSGSSVEERFQGFDKVTADGGAQHNATSCTTGNVESVDDRHRSAYTESEQLVV